MIADSILIWISYPGHEDDPPGNKKLFFLYYTPARTIVKAFLSLCGVQQTASFVGK
jgi:hypothetical protein